MFLTLCFCAVPLSSGNALNAILDEIIAGCEANVALIDRGWARYDVTTTTADPSKLGQAARQKYERPLLKGTQPVRIDFDRTRCRWTIGRIRCYRDDKHDVYFDAQTLEEGHEQKVPSHDAVHYRASIHAVHTSPFSPTPYHPRYLGHGIDGRENDKTIADVLKGARKRLDVWSINVVPEEKLLKVMLDSKASSYRAVFWVSPQQGYSPVRGERWSLKVSDTTPASEFKVEYKQIQGGVFVASRRLQINRRPIDHQKYVESDRTEAVLTDIALGDQPKEDLFSLPGLGVPRGTIVRDKTTGKEYLYDVKNVTEGDINKKLDLIAEGKDPDPEKRPPPRQVEPTRRRTLIRLAIAGGCLLVLLVLIWYRLRTRTSGSPS